MVERLLIMREVQDRYPASPVRSCYRDKMSWHQHFPNVHFAVHLRNPLTLSNIFLSYKTFPRHVYVCALASTCGRLGSFALLPALPFRRTALVAKGVASRYWRSRCLFTHWYYREQKDRISVLSR